MSLMPVREWHSIGRSVSSCQADLKSAFGATIALASQLDYVPMPVQFTHRQNSGRSCRLLRLKIGQRRGRLAAAGELS